MSCIRSQLYRNRIITPSSRTLVSRASREKIQKESGRGTISMAEDEVDKVTEMLTLSSVSKHNSLTSRTVYNPTSSTSTDYDEKSDYASTQTSETGRTATSSPSSSPLEHRHSSPTVFPSADSSEEYILRLAIANGKKRQKACKFLTAQGNILGRKKASQEASKVKTAVERCRGKRLEVKVEIARCTQNLHCFVKEDNLRLNNVGRRSIIPT